MDNDRLSYLLDTTFQPKNQTLILQWRKAKTASRRKSPAAFSCVNHPPVFRAMAASCVQQKFNSTTKSSTILQNDAERKFRNPQ